MTRPRIAVSSRVHGTVIEQLRSRGDVAGTSSLEAWTREELIANARRAHALLAFMRRIGWTTRYWNAVPTSASWPVR